VAALMPTMGPGAISLLSTLAYPFVQLFSLFSVSIPAATGAALAFATGALSLGVLHMLGRKTIYPEESTSAADGNKTVPTKSVSNDGAEVASDNDLSNGWVVEGSIDADPYVRGSSSMLNNSFGKLGAETPKITDDGFKPSPNQATM
jgi:hypothetical protein